MIIPVDCFVDNRSGWSSKRAIAQSNFPSYSSRRQSEKCSESSSSREKQFLLQELHSSFLAGQRHKECIFSEKCLSDWIYKIDLLQKIGSYKADNYKLELPITITAQQVCLFNQELSCDLLGWNTVDFQLCCVGHVTGLIGHLAGESAAVGVVHRLYAQHASARPQLGGRDADVRGHVLPLHAPADLEGGVSVVYGTK